MTKIKICGFTREEDIEYVNELLPDYVGFVFAKSKRQVNLEKAKELIDKLDKNIKTVGVFVNEEISKVKNIAESLKLDVIQFHGSEGDEYISNFNKFELWKSMSIKVDLSKGEDLQRYKEHISLNLNENNDNLYEIDKYQSELDKLNSYNIKAILLDSSVKGVEGGTGISFDWNVIPKLSINKKLILAGGLRIDNVKDAISIVKPYAVDVSSGVETEGIKDFHKIKKFIENVRNI